MNVINVVGGIRETDVKEFNQLTNTTPRTTKYEHKIVRLNKIDDYDMYINDMNNIEYGMCNIILTAGTCGICRSAWTW